MNVSSTSYCRLCAALSPASDVLDLTVNILLRTEIIEKLSIFKINTVDFTDETLPEIICVLCMNSVQSSFDFFKKIQHSQTVLKTVNTSIIFSSNADKSETKKGETLHEVIELDDEKSNSVECNFINTDSDNVDYGQSLDENEDVSLSVHQVYASNKNCNKEANNVRKVNKKTMQKSIEYEDDRFECTACGKSFESWKELQQHTSTDNDHVPRKRTKATIEEKTCDICFKVFDLPSRLRNHRVKHSERPRDYVCDVCGKAFYTKNTLNSHKVIHNPETQHCKICKKTFINLIRLRKHLKTHIVTKPFECNDCQRTFRLKYQLSQHMIVHSDVFPYFCEYCKKGFRFKSVLKSHMNIHTGAKSFECTVCEKDFTNWSNCNKHMVRKHGVSLAKRVKTAHGMMPLNQGTLKPKEVDMESVKWGEQMSKPRKRGGKRD